MQNLVHPKEKQYHRVAFVFSMIVYGILALILVSAIASGGRSGAIAGVGLVFLLAFYVGLIWFALFFAQGYFIARLRKNAVKLGERQFGDVLALVKSIAADIGMKEAPEVYLLQEGGVLNAFATKFLSRNFMVIYSEVFELAYAEGEDALKFVIAHELGHIHRRHLRGRWKIIPGFIIPFLAMAYSRGCEYTCDRYGKAYGKPSGNQGLLLLAAGKALYGKVNEEEIVKQAEEEQGFFMWLAEVNASHPSLARRIKHFKEFSVS
jgi:Zn-dependent protease with chaperone function